VHHPDLLNPLEGIVHQGDSKEPAEMISRKADIAEPFAEAGNSGAPIQYRFHIHDLESH
jgi:hypothetical protein